jgi:Copper type II ascorbate-dependent monooxygenase, C-terminal domain
VREYVRHEEDEVVRRVAAFALIAAVAGAVATAVFARGDSPAAAPTYYQDVKPILDGRCTGCHYPGGIAPFALTSYDAAHARRQAIAAAVEARLMPPWHAAEGVQTYKHDPTLSRAQIETLGSWAATGGRAGDRADPVPAIPSVAPRLSRVDVRLTMPEAYTPTRRADADDYRCFALPWSRSAATNITGVNVIPGRPVEVHHIILYLAPPGSASKLARWDAADPGAGYGCYGGPSATGAKESLETPQFLAGWVPGSAGGDLPAGTGIEVPPGSSLILQVHYNLEYAAPRPDRSVVELSTAAKVERRGIYLPLVNPMWVFQPTSFAIPKGKKNVVHTFSAPVSAIAALLGSTLDLKGGFEIHRVALHMHRLGVDGEIGVERASGRNEPLLAVPRWDFNWQREYELAKPVPVASGDSLTIRCRHDNSPVNQPFIRSKQSPPHLVTWGEDSSDEMCIGFLYITKS